MTDSAAAAPAPAPAPRPATTAATAAPPPAHEADKLRRAARLKPVARRARARGRHWGVLLAFLIMVAAPTAAATWYLYTRAADQYAATLGFTLRTADVSATADLLGGLGGAFGGTSTRDTDILYEFIRSQELVALIDARLDLRSLWSAPRATDPVLTFDPEGTIEDLTRYWRRMVRIAYDANSGLMEVRALAFDAASAKAIAEAIAEESSTMINALSASAREDATAYARDDLARAEERLKTAREALTAYRIENQIVDVTADIQGQMGLLNTLQAQLAEALIDLDLLRETAREGDPRLDQAQSRITVIEARIEEERQKFGAGASGPGGGNYATTVAEFERLTVEREFAEQAYLAALSAYDAARAEANRQTLYLAAYIRPTLAERSLFPQRPVMAGLVALFSFLIWAIICLIGYALRDSR